MFGNTGLPETERHMERCPLLSLFVKTDLADLIDK